MNPEWPERPLGDVLDLLLDHRGKTPKKLGGEDFTDEGVPVVSAIHIKGGRIEWSERERFVPRWMFEKWMPQRLRKGDVLLTSEAPLGQVAEVPTDDDLVLSQRLFALRGKTGLLDSGFLRYFLQTDAAQNQLVGRASGTTVIGIRQAELVRMTVPTPPPAVQRAIAGVLGALDGKIAANTKLAATADELARLRFRAMQRGGSTEIPLSVTARFVNGRNFTKGATGSGRVVVRIAELNSGVASSTVRNEVSAADDNVAHPGDLLFAWSGSLTVRRWWLDEAVVNQHIFKVIPASGYPKWLVHQLLLDKIGDFRSIAADKATTMGHIQRRHLDELVVVPLAESVAAADEVMSALWNRALLAERESEQLAATRDALLPALMSGRLRVRDAERIVDDVRSPAADDVARVRLGGGRPRAV